MVGYIIDTFDKHEITMIKLHKILHIMCMCFLTFVNAQADEVNADQRFFYIGTEAGIVEAMMKVFHHNSYSNFFLKKSKMYSGKIGYSFYPQMAIEFSAIHQPQYQLHYVLPHMDVTPSVIVLQTSQFTQVVSDVYMVNLVYDFNKVEEITPFVILGVGVAQVKIRPDLCYYDLIDMQYFKINTTRNNDFAWQVCIGFSKDLSSSFSIDLAVKLQATHLIKIKHDILDINVQQFIPAILIKKAIRVGEIGIGFTYKLMI